MTNAKNNNWAPPTAEQLAPQSSATRPRWKLWGILGGGILLIGVVGAILNPDTRTDAATSAPTTLPETAVETAPLTTADTPGIIDGPTTTVIAATAAPEPPPTTAAPVVPVLPVVPVAPEPTAPPAVTTYAVAHVVDGDTIDVKDGSGAELRVRLIGIDTPEMDTCGGQPASDALEALVAGRQVRLTMGGDGEDTDRYGRLLRYVDVDGTDSGMTLIEQGFAIARYDSRDGYGRHVREDSYVAADAASPNYGCPTAPAPVAEVASTAPAVIAPPPTPPAGDVHYENCTAVKAAGAAPIHPGDPGWQTKFDRDGDGVGCES